MKLTAEQTNKAASLIIGAAYFLLAVALIRVVL